MMKIMIIISSLVMTIIFIHFLLLYKSDLG